MFPLSIQILTRKRTTMTEKKNKKKQKKKHVNSLLDGFNVTVHSYGFICLFLQSNTFEAQLYIKWSDT